MLFFPSPFEANI